jgi:hypothetical protein
MAKTKWKLTKEGEIDEWGREPLRLDKSRMSLLEDLADDPLNELVEVRPGVYLGPKAS